MVKFYRVPDYIQNKYTSWKTDAKYGRKEWLNRAVSSENYYYHDVEDTGTTFTQTQKDTITESTNIPISINFLHPITNQKLAILAQVKPSIRIVATDSRAREYAFVLDKIKHGIFYTSNAPLEVENMIKDMLVAGMGHIMVLPADLYNPGLFDVRIAHVPYDEVILDINSKKRSLEDMEGFFIEREFTIPKFLQLYHPLISEVKDEQGNPVTYQTFTNKTWVENDITDKAQVITTTWNADDRVTVREFYEKVVTEAYLIPNPESGVLDYVFAENIPNEEDMAILTTAEKVITGTYIKKSIIFADYVVWESILPINDYPLVTTFFEWGGKPYRSYGMIHFLKNNQEGYDKILQIMLLNGILSNNAGWMVPKGSIAEEDKKKWENYANDPRVLKEFVPVIREGQVIVPTKEEVHQLSNFYPTILEMLLRGMEYTSGVSAILQGNAQEANIEVFSSLQQYQNAAMMRVILSTNHINEALKNLGNVLVQYILANIQPTHYSFLDEKGDLNELEIVTKLANDLKQYKYLVCAVPATSMPTQKLAIGTELMKIAQSSPNPAERQILTQKALQLSDIREYDSIAEQLDVVKNTQAELNNLQEAYNRLLEMSKQMENKFVNISLENRILKQLSTAQADLSTAVAVAETEVSLATEMAKAKIEGQQKITK